MKISQADLLEVQTKLSPMLGQKPWGAAIDENRCLSFELGERIQHPAQPESLPSGDRTARDGGEWHLLIYSCVWRIEKDGRMLAGLDIQEPEMKAILEALENKALVSVELSPPLWDTSFVFEDGFTLRTFSVYTEEEIHWQLFAPDGNVLSLGPGTSWSYTSCSELPHHRVET